MDEKELVKWLINELHRNHEFVRKLLFLAFVQSAALIGVAISGVLK